MKEGTGGDPFADDPEDSSDDTDTDPITSTSETMSETTTETASSTIDDESTESLPYIYQRDTVKDGRDQVPFFLRDHVRELENEFIDQLEERLDETVYKADAREAVLEVAFENQIEATADRLREWGYDR